MTAGSSENARKQTSQRQVHANRKNAGKSTGPRTEAGKRRSSQNATRHGVNAQWLFAIPSGVLKEDPEQLQARVDEFVQSLDPRDAVEREVAMRAALESIRLSRIDRCEAQAIAGDGAMHRFLVSDVDIWGDHRSVAPHLTQLARFNPELLIDEIMMFNEHLAHGEWGEQEDWSRAIRFVRSIHGEPAPEWFEMIGDELLGSQRDTFFSLVSGHWGDEVQAGKWAVNLAGKLQGLVSQAKMTGEAIASQAALAGNMENASRLRARSEKSLRALLRTYQELRSRPLTDGTTEADPPTIAS
jgi:hypothetical protein